MLASFVFNPISNKPWASAFSAQQLATKPTGFWSKFRGRSALCDLRENTCSHSYLQIGSNRMLTLSDLQLVLQLHPNRQSTTSRASVMTPTSGGNIAEQTLPVRRLDQDSLPCNHHGIFPIRYRLRVIHSIVAYKLRFNCLLITG